MLHLLTASVYSWPCMVYLDKMPSLFVISSMSIVFSMLEITIGRVSTRYCSEHDSSYNCIFVLFLSQLAPQSRLRQHLRATMLLLRRLFSFHSELLYANFCFCFLFTPSCYCKFLLLPIQQPPVWMLISFE